MVYRMFGTISYFDDQCCGRAIATARSRTVRALLLCASDAAENAPDQSEGASIPSSDR